MEISCRSGRSHFHHGDYQCTGLVSPQTGGSNQANPETVDPLRRNCVALRRVGDSALDRQTLWLLWLHTAAALGNHTGGGDRREPYPVPRAEFGGVSEHGNLYRLRRAAGDRLHDSVCRAAAATAVADHTASLHPIRYPALLGGVGRLVRDSRCRANFGRQLATAGAEWTAPSRLFHELSDFPNA